MPATQGQTVLYQPGPQDSIPQPPGGRGCTAIVASVPGGALVNLMVVDAYGNPVSRTSVPWVDFGQQPPAQGSYCKPELPHGQGLFATPPARRA